ncbi:MAG: hypothetical protein RLZZ536_561 [Planctomycetota bacterium]
MSGDFGGRFRITGCGRAGSRWLAFGGGIRLGVEHPEIWVTVESEDF